MNILIKVDKKTSTEWLAMVGKINMSSEIFNHRFQRELLTFAENVYCYRQELIGNIERTYVAPILMFRNKYDWSMFAAYGFLVLAVDDAYAQYELDFLHKTMVSFIASNGDHSADKFGEDADAKQLLETYDKTEPQKIGFNVK